MSDNKEGNESDVELSSSSSSSSSDDEGTQQLIQKRSENRESDYSDDDNELLNKTKNDDDFQGADEDQNQEEQSIAKRRAKGNKVLTEGEKLVEQAMKESRSVYVKYTDDEESKINEAKAKSLIEEMERAYETDLRGFHEKKPKFERLNFLKRKIEPCSHNRKLTNALMKEGILDQFVKWFKGFEEGVMPTTTVVELILKTLQSYDISDELLSKTEIIKGVRELLLKEGTKAKQIKDELINTWKRKILNAKSGASEQKTGYLDSENIEEVKANILQRNAINKRRIESDRKRHKILEEEMRKKHKIEIEEPGYAKERHTRFVKY